MQTVDRNIYGARETNGLVDGNAYHAARRAAPEVDWTEPGLKITRLRLLSDPGYPFWDVSYCDGELDGEPVNVILPFSALPKRNLKAKIIEHAKAARLFAKGLGILDCISTLI